MMSLPVPGPRVGISLGPNLDAYGRFAEAWRAATGAAFSSVWLQDRSGSPGAGLEPTGSRWSHLERLARSAGGRFGILAGGRGPIDALLAELPHHLRRWGIPARIGIGSGWCLGGAEARADDLVVSMARLRRGARLPRRPDGRNPQLSVLVGGLTGSAFTLAATHGSGWGAAASPVRLARAGERVRWLARSLGRSPDELEGVGVIPVHVVASPSEAVRLRDRPDRLLGPYRPVRDAALTIGTVHDVRSGCEPYLGIGLSEVVFEPVVPPGPVTRTSRALVEQVEALAEISRPWFA